MHEAGKEGDTLYVYKYTDKNDDMVKYVGITNDLTKRVREHKRDKWSVEGDWQIDYFEVDTLTDAQALEGHFISEYGTADYYNKSKTKWGKCTFAPTVKWVNYKGSGGIPYYTEIERRYYEAQHQITHLSEEIRHLNHLMNKNAKESASKFFKDTFVEQEYSIDGKWYYIDKDTCYKLYNEFAELYTCAYYFEDSEELWELLYRTKKARERMDEERLENVIPYESELYDMYIKIRNEERSKEMEKIHLVM